MERHRASPFIGTALLLSLMVAVAPGAFAANYGLDITVYDGTSPNGQSGWYGGTGNVDGRTGVREDNETESPPATLIGQEWDLEAVHYDEGTYGLSLVGGWNFPTTLQGHASGDIFIAINRGSQVWPYDTGEIYDYVIDLDWNPNGTFSGNYSIYAISTVAGNGANLNTTNGLQSVNAGQVLASNPYRYTANGTLVGSGTGANVVHYAVDTNFGGSYTPVGYNGNNNHYVLTGIDLQPIFLHYGVAANAAVNEFYTHFTQSCGNDVLNGYFKFEGTEVPEPATLGLLGLALAGLGIRRRMVKK